MPNDSRYEEKKMGGMRTSLLSQIEQSELDGLMDENINFKSF